MSSGHPTVGVLHRMSEAIQAVGLAYYRLYCALEAEATGSEIEELNDALRSAAERVSMVLADSRAPTTTKETT